MKHLWCALRSYHVVTSQSPTWIQPGDLSWYWTLESQLPAAIPDGLGQDGQQSRSPSVQIDDAIPIGCNGHFAQRLRISWRYFSWGFLGGIPISFWFLITLWKRREQSACWQGTNHASRLPLRAERNQALQGLLQTLQRANGGRLVLRALLSEARTCLRQG